VSETAAPAEAGKKGRQVKIGRVSSIETRSPVDAASFSSCAMKRDRRLM